MFICEVGDASMFLSIVRLRPWTSRVIIVILVFHLVYCWIISDLTTAVATSVERLLGVRVILS